jgi:hypothetical protein
VGVAGEVVEHGRRPAERGFRVDDPVLPRQSPEPRPPRGRDAQGGEWSGGVGAQSGTTRTNTAKRFRAIRPVVRIAVWSAAACSRTPKESDKRRAE